MLCGTPPVTQERDASVMAASPRFKVYDADGEYVASFKYLEHAACLVAGIGGAGTTIRDRHATILWTEGSEEFPAAESYDGVAQVAWARLNDPNLHGKR